MLTRRQYSRAASVLHEVASDWRKQPEGSALARNTLELRAGLCSDDPGTRAGWEAVQEMNEMAGSSARNTVLARLESQAEEWELKANRVRSRMWESELELHDAVARRPLGYGRGTPSAASGTGKKHLPGTTRR